MLSSKATARTIFLSSQASELIDISLLRAMLNVHPLEIPSSNFSSLLSCFSSDFKPSIGFVDVESTFSHYQALCSLGFKSAPLNSMGFALNPILIHRVAQLFS